MDECKPLITGSHSVNITSDDVERDCLEADLVYKGVLDCFSRKWKLVGTDG